MLLCDKAQSVMGVELNESAVRDAVFNKKLNKIINYRVLCADATKYLTGLGGQDAFDVVVMDPPRAGSTPAFIDAVVRSKVKRVVYISCDPETLVRDLKLFIKGGFKVIKAVPIDMFPGTGHTETIVVINREGSLKKQLEKGKQTERSLR